MPYRSQKYYIINICPSVDEVNRQISLLKNNKATGPGEISAKLLKLAGQAVVARLTSLFKRSTRECRVYSDWKMSRLTPVHKKYDPTDIGNYRPLSLLSVPRKIFKSCVADNCESCFQRRARHGQLMGLQKREIYRASSHSPD